MCSLASHTLRIEEGSGHAAADEFVAEERNYQTARFVPSLSPQLSSLAVRITHVICTSSDDSCGGGLGTRLWLDNKMLTSAKHARC